MSGYTCKRCGYYTEYLCNYKKHLKRSLLCDPKISDNSLDDEKSKYLSKVKVITHTCKCGKEYTTRQGLYLHKKNCKYVDENTDETSNNITETSHDKTTIDRIKILEEELTHLKQTLQIHPTINNTTNNNNNTTNNNNNTTNNNTTNNNITLIINDFGNEDIKHIANDKEFLEKCMKELFTSAIENMVKKIYFDKDHPENNNIKMQNIKLNHVMIRKNGDWERTNVSGPAIKMIRKSKNILQDHYISSGESQKEIERMIEEELIEPDKKMTYLSKIISPDTNEHKIAISKVKGVISNYKFIS